jgi:hypothetical protein
MTTQARLQKVTQGLSALQRISLILQAQREGREPDPELSRISDTQQNKAFNRYVALLYVINRELGALCHTLSGWSQFLDQNASQVRLLNQAAAVLEEEYGMEPTNRPRDWRTTGNMEVPEFLRSLARELQAGLVDSIGQRWREVAALELVWAELAAEFGGEDPLAPELRSMAEETKQGLLSLAREFNGNKRLQGPDEPSLAEVRRQVDEAFDKLRPLL